MDDLLRLRLGRALLGIDETEATDFVTEIPGPTAELLARIEPIIDSALANEPDRRKRAELLERRERAEVSELGPPGWSREI